MDEPMHVFSPSNCCPNRPPAWWFLPLCLPSLPLWFVVHRRGGGREKPPLSAVGATWVRSYGSFSRRRHIRPAVAPGGRSPVRERERDRESEAFERETEGEGSGVSGLPARTQVPPPLFGIFFFISFWLN